MAKKKMRKNRRNLEFRKPPATAEHICLGCQKVTTSRSSICSHCSHYNPVPYDVPNALPSSVMFQDDFGTYRDFGKRRICHESTSDVLAPDFGRDDAVETDVERELRDLMG